MKKKFSIKKLIIFLLILLIIFALAIVSTYFIMIGPKDKNTKEKEFEIKQGWTYYDVAEELEKENYIKSALFFKLYLKINKIDSVEAGKYKISSSNKVEEIIEIFKEGNNTNENAVLLTIPEGKHITDIADYMSKISGKEFSYYLKVWQSKEFINNVIEKYWFITNKVKNKKIKYALEGYFFPNTYELQDKDVTPEYVAYKLLDQTDIILTKYKDEIEKSKYSVHELLTMASIVEHEAILDEDRPLIASVFYNRLDANMKLQSCATVGYAIDEWKLTYSSSDLNTDSPYNTYYYTGLPVGPGNSPSEKSIEAAINPAESKYYYFMADVCSGNQKTYFSKSYSEHTSKVNKYLGCL